MTVVGSGGWAQPVMAAPLAAPATITVTTLLDKIDPNDGLCSLREALQRAFDNSAFNSQQNDCPQSASGNSVIKFGVPGTIIISHGYAGGQLPNIINYVTLIGPITIDASDANQILFDVEPSGHLNFIGVSVMNATYTAVDNRGELNVAGGAFINNASGAPGGGAIRNDGTAMVAGVQFVGNKAALSSYEGGAIRSTWVLTVAGSTFNGNTSDANGGAIAVKSGRLDIADSAFSGNITRGGLPASARGQGGGAVYITDNANTYPMTITRSSFQGNYATEGVGGALFHNAYVDLTVSDSSFQANGVGSPGNLGSGGAIRSAGPLTLTRSIFVANTAQGDGGAISNDFYGQIGMRMVGFVGTSASGKGGAIANLDVTGGNSPGIDAVGVSLTGNTAGSEGGGIYNYDSGYDKAVFQLSLFAANLPQNCRDRFPADDHDPISPVPPIISKGLNSFSDDTCDDRNNTDVTNADAKLLPPAFNGGAVPGLLTQKPMTDSPLVDVIPLASWPFLDGEFKDKDVRGRPRPQNGHGSGPLLYDIGPYELDDQSPMFSSLPPNSGVVDIGGVQASKTITKPGAIVVFNAGELPLALSGAFFFGAQASDFAFTAMPGPIAKGQSAAIAISCKPSATGARTAGLGFNTNDPQHSYVTYDMKCAGLPAVSAGFASTPEQPGPITTEATLGKPITMSLNVRETGNGPLSLSNPVLSSAQPGAFTLITAFPINIVDGVAAQNVQVRCNADALGLKSGAITFSTNDPGNPTVVVNLTCTVKKPDDALLAAASNSYLALGSTAFPYGLAISPDGRYVYVANAGYSRVTVHEVAADDTLVYRNAFNSSSLSASERFTTPYQVAVSPDGNNVYVTGYGANAIASFTRTQSSGALNYLDTVKQGSGYGCYIFDIPPCTTFVTGMSGAYGIAISPDGKFVYVSSISDSSVVVLRRDTDTGRLSGLPYFYSGANFLQRYTNANLTSAYGLAVSPDGANLYVTGYTSDALITLKRDPNAGTLSTSQVLTPSAASGLNGVFRVIVSKDGQPVYTAAFDSDSVCAFQRAMIDGTLTPIGCSTNLIGRVANLDAASDLAITPDGLHLLATAYNSGSVVAFGRDPASGSLSYREAITSGTPVLQPAVGNARGIVINPNGKAAYATGYFPDSVVSVLFGKPKPVTAGLVPGSVPTGTAGLALVVTGDGFSPDSQVRIGGAGRPTTYQNETRLIAALSSADLAVAGNKSITVYTPGPGGGTSNIVTLTVQAFGATPIPAIDVITLQGAVAGDGPVTVDVRGSGFAIGAQVTFNGALRATTRFSDTLLRATLTDADMLNPGKGVIAVVNGGVVLGRGEIAASGSNPVGLVVVPPNQNPAAGLGQLAPTHAAALGKNTQLEVTLTGTNFVNGAQARWNAQPRPTKFVSATVLKMTISAADLAAPAPASVSVVNPNSDDQSSNVLTFLVTGPILPAVYLPIMH